MIRDLVVSTSRTDSPPNDPPSRAAAEIDRLTPSISGWRLEQTDWWKNIDGYTDDPSLATPEKGAQFLEIVIDALATVMRDFMGR